jgi:hypothetical protein
MRGLLEMAFMRMRSPSKAPPVRRAWIDGDDRDVELVVLILSQTQDQFVGQRGLAGTARCR